MDACGQGVSGLGFSRSISWRRKIIGCATPTTQESIGGRHERRRSVGARPSSSLTWATSCLCFPGVDEQLSSRPSRPPSGSTPRRVFFIGSPQNGRHRVRGISTLLRKTSAASQGTTLQLHVSNPFSFSYLKIENIRSLVRVLSTFKVHLFESFERRASMTPFLTRRCVFPRILFFFSFLYFLHRGLWIFRRNVFWYNDRFEPTFDVKGHLEWGLRYRRCDRVSGCCSGWPYFLQVKSWNITEMMETWLWDEFNSWHFRVNVSISTTDACNYDNGERNSFDLIS